MAVNFFIWKGKGGFGGFEMPKNVNLRGGTIVSDWLLLSRQERLDEKGGGWGWGRGSLKLYNESVHERQNLARDRESVRAFFRV